MSRIGKKIITIPEKTTVSVSGSTVSVKGPKGGLSREFPTTISVSVSGSEVSLSRKDENVEDALWGAYASHLTNMIEGVGEGFVRKLIIEGIGYKADVKGTGLVLSLGFSHPVAVPIPSTLKVTSDKGIVTVSGVDKEVVGKFAAEVRSLKKPEPYKGKGIRYDDEVIRRKQGKKTV